MAHPPDVAYGRYGRYGRSNQPPYDPPVPYLSRLSKGQVDGHMLAAAASRSRQWHQLGPRVGVAAPSLHECWGRHRLRFFIEYKGKKVLLSEPFKDSILELCPATTASEDFIPKYFTELGSGWCCNAPGRVVSDAQDPDSFIFVPSVESVDTGGHELSSIIERQLGVLAGDLEATRQWLDLVAEESTAPMSEDTDLQDWLEGEVWLRDGTESCGYTAEPGSARLLFPRSLGDKHFVGAALFSQRMLALHAQLDSSVVPIGQWQGKPPIDLSVNDAINCVVRRWRDNPPLGIFPVPNPSFGYTDVVYTGMGARLDAWWDECQRYPGTHGTRASGHAGPVSPPRLRYVLHRLHDKHWADQHFPPGHARHNTVEALMRSGKDYRYRETSAPGMVGYEDVAYYPPLWLARSAYAAAALASAPSPALAQRLAVLREQLISRYGSPASDRDEGSDMLDEDGEPWPRESVSDYVLLLALMPRVHDFSQAPRRVWLPMQLVTPEDDGWN